MARPFAPIEEQRIGLKKSGPIAIHVHRMSLGTWRVSDIRNMRGGYFRTRASALSYIRQTYGRDVPIIFDPLG